MKKDKITILIAVIISATIVATSLFFWPIESPIQAQVGGPIIFGGRFVSINTICCDGTMILNFESADPSQAQGTFKTNWAMTAYSNLYYFPLPTTCAIGRASPGGVCQTVSSYCEGSEQSDYTITMIGTGFLGCEFAQ